jgi:hypothetical protein
MPAPGAKCPDCILAARREREASKVVDVAAAGGSIARTPEEAQLRDRALLDLLQFGPANFERLVSVMPGTFLSDEARTSACRLALLRMKVKGTVVIVPEGYARA